METTTIFKTIIYIVIVPIKKDSNHSWYKKSYCDNITVWQVPVGNGNDKSEQLDDQNEINDDTTVYISQSSGNSNNNKFSKGGLEWKVQVSSTTSKVSPNTKTNNNNNIIINLYDNFSLLSASLTSTILKIIKNKTFPTHKLCTVC
jgi:hypothetical protein